jgi:hypothetical protein
MVTRPVKGLVDFIMVVISLVTCLTQSKMWFVYFKLRMCGEGSRSLAALAVARKTLPQWLNTLECYGVPARRPKTCVLRASKSSGLQGGSTTRSETRDFRDRWRIRAPPYDVRSSPLSSHSQLDGCFPPRGRVKSWGGNP